MRLVHRCHWMVRQVIGPELNNVVGLLTVWENAGVRFAVRENTTRSGRDQFFQGGGVGAAYCYGRKPKSHADVLEVVMHPDHQDELQATMALVATMDPLKRKVRTHRSMTWKWVREEVSWRAQVSALSCHAGGRAYVYADGTPAVEYEARKPNRSTTR